MKTNDNTNFVWAKKKTKFKFCGTRGVFGLTLDRFPNFITKAINF